MAALLAALIPFLMRDAGAGTAPPNGAAAMRVLVVLTSADHLGSTSDPVSGPPTGYRAGDVAEAVPILTAAGVELEFASPKGGAPQRDPVYGAGRTGDELEDTVLRAALRASLRLSDLKAANYSGVLIIGGRGALVDLSQDRQLQAIVRDVYEREGVIGAIGEGVAGLLDVTLAGDVAILSQRTVTAAIDEEQQAFGGADALPFSLEGRLRERGFVFNESAPFQPNVIVSRRIVTGQNPASSAGVAHFMQKLLFKEKIQSGPAKRP